MEVDRVEFTAERGRIDVWVVYPTWTRFSCHQCELELAVYDYAAQRVCHLDGCQLLSYQQAEPPRVKGISTA